MRLQSTWMKCVLVLCVAGTVLAGLVYGQSHAAAGRERSDKGDVVRIRRFMGAGPRIVVETPKYQVTTTIQGGVKNPQKWGKVTVYYDTTPEWIDDLSFQYFVMSRKMEGSATVFSFYTVTVRYMDIRRGVNHESSVFLRPSALERHGDVIAAAVEISSGGKVLAEETHQEGVKLADRWWRQPAVVESKDVAARDGYLVDRAHSPFALVNIDDQEAIRQ
jgi:hypothetical protein